MFDIVEVYSRFKKSFSLKDGIFFISNIVLYGITRLVNLDKFPIFSDEGIYIHWAKVAWHDATWRFISLTDGKQPLQTWGTIPFLKLFPDNLLLGGRMFAVATGLFALIGVFVLLYYLFGKRAAFTGMLLYIFTPYFLFYDRLALVDSGVNGFFIWILFLSILLASTRRLDISLFFGFFSGFGLLAKSSAQIFVALSALAPVLFVEKNLKKFSRHLVNYLFLYGIGVIIAVLIYNVQRLSPFLHFVGEKNHTFVMTFSDFLKSPFEVFTRNVTLVPYYALSESGYILGIFALFGLILLYKKHTRLFFYFLMWIVFPYILISFFSIVLFPRYIIFFGTLFMILGAYWLSQIKNKTYLIIAVLVYALSVAYFDYTILFDYAHIPFPPIDRGQYIEGWPAGWGMTDIIDFARQKSKEKPVILLAEGNFGMSGDVLDVFMRNSDTISIRAYWPLELKELQENQKDLKDHYIYIVLTHKFDYPADWPMKLVKRYDKPGKESVTYLYELTN